MKGILIEKGDAIMLENLHTQSTHMVRIEAFISSPIFA